MILDNKTKSVENCDIIGEHKINGIPNLYLRVNKTNKVFRLKAKKWLTLGIFGVDTSLRKAELLSKIISIKIKQGVLIEQLDSTLSLTKNPDDFDRGKRTTHGPPDAHPHGKGSGCWGSVRGGRGGGGLSTPGSVG